MAGSFWLTLKSREGNVEKNRAGRTVFVVTATKNKKKTTPIFPGDFNQ